MNILVTDSTYKHSLGIIRQLGKDGYKPYILSFQKSSLCSYSRYTNKELLISTSYSKEELVELCQNYDINLIILVGTDSFKKIVPWKQFLEENNIKIISVEKDILDIAFSKKETYALAEEVGVPIPKTFYPKSFAEIETLKKQITFPCVIKGLYEVGGNIVDYAYNEKELSVKYIAVCEKYNLKEDELPMIQEYITDDGCAFFAVYNHGKCGYTFQHKRVREYPVSGGASVCAESYKNDKVLKYGKKILDYLQWHGVAMVEFKLNSKGEPILMEINPKFWGSTDLVLEAGVNFPKALIDIYLEKEIPYSDNYKIPLKYHWLLDGEIKHAIKNPKAIPSIILDTLNPKVKGNIWLSDFKPTLAKIAEIFNSIKKRIF
jgi:predicted ATP-grasp superfamily ATP-dependent carboligase